MEYSKKGDNLVELINKLREFHKTFEIPLRNEFSKIPAEEYTLRYKLMQEENDEYLKACVMGDKVEIADALGDQLYVLLGTICQHGLQDKIGVVFDLIHENNMSKLDENGRVLRDENGKVKKPSNFKPVDLTKIISND